MKTDRLLNKTFAIVDVATGRVIDRTFSKQGALIVQKHCKEPTTIEVRV